MIRAGCMPTLAMMGLNSDANGRGNEEGEGLLQPLSLFDDRIRLSINPQMPELGQMPGCAHPLSVCVTGIRVLLR